MEVDEKHRGIEREGSPRREREEGSHLSIALGRAGRGEVWGVGGQCRGIVPSFYLQRPRSNQAWAWIVGPHKNHTLQRSGLAHKE